MSHAHHVLSISHAASLAFHITLTVFYNLIDTPQHEDWSLRTVRRIRMRFCHRAVFLGTLFADAWFARIQEATLSAQNTHEAR